jgi:ribonuclease BN (tRNA processing enzyme)
MTVTHGHLDHTLVIPGIVSAYSVYGKAAQIYVPEEIEAFTHSFVQSSMEMNWSEKIDPKKGRQHHHYRNSSF